MKKILFGFVVLLAILSIGATTHKAYTYKFYNPRTQETIIVTSNADGLQPPIGYIKIASTKSN